MKPKVIKTDEEHAAALAHMRTLIDAAPDSPEEEELELFALLIEQYEKERWPVDLPDPVDAIEFRMDQAGLTRKDLGKYLGSASKVSEVMNRRRPLTLTMMRALHEGLGIPAEVLLQQPGETLPPHEYDVRDYPFSEMFKKGYFGGWAGTLREAKEVAEELLTGLFASLGGRVSQPVYCRRADREVDTHALTAWQARALALVQSEELPPYDPNEIDDVFFGKIIRLSYYSEGPRLIPELLRRCGIHFVLLSHLPKMYLDGACFLCPAGRPVIGMTLRHDRLDNFWFTLLHELAHLKLHVHEDGPAFFDETEHNACEDEDPREAEANAFARDRLVPDTVWQQEGPRLLASVDDQDVLDLAERLEISPAIIAGRIRWEMKNYAVLTPLVGNGAVRCLFQDQLQP